MKIKIVEARDLSSNDLRARSYVDKRPINEEQLKTFLEILKEEMLKTRAAHPEFYVWPIENIGLVMKAMEDSLRQNRYLWSTPSFRATCRRLKIKNTRTAIEQYIRPA